MEQSLTEEEAKLVLSSNGSSESRMHHAWIFFKALGFIILLLLIVSMLRI